MCLSVYIYIYIYTCVCDSLVYFVFVCVSHLCIWFIIYISLEHKPLRAEMIVLFTMYTPCLPHNGHWVNVPCINERGKGKQAILYNVVKIRNGREYSH